jgi:S-adenosylmethionine-dependent methyltransferase
LLLAIDLAKQGHSVTLNDLSEKSLEIAAKNAEKESVALEATIHANALDITQHVSEGSFDIVLCLGPLYHLLRPDERTQVIRNSIYAAKTGGYVVLAYVSIYAHLRDVARRDPSRLSKEWDFYEGYLRTGAYTRRRENESFHVYPADLDKELEGLEGRAEVLKVVSAEGFLGFDGGKALAGLQGEELERWVDVVMLSAGDERTVNAADHLVVVLQKTG